MLKFGIFRLEDYQPGRRPRWRLRLSWRLLRTAIPPSPSEMALFEEAIRELRLSNGVYRTTFRGRFAAQDEHVNRLLAERFPAGASLHIEDWAASDCLASKEWATALEPLFPNATLHASDFTLYLTEATRGEESFILEPDGNLLQYVRPPFVLCCNPPESWLFPINRWLMARAIKRWKRLRILFAPLPDWHESGCATEYAHPPFTLRGIPLIHPEVEAFRRAAPRFFIGRHSVFDPLPNPCNVIRTMNIFNLQYFSREWLRRGVEAVHRSLLPDGIWIVGRTLSDDERLHAVSVLVKRASTFQLLERIGGGSEIEDLALAHFGA